MLGSVRQKQVWAWGAAGKHPVARDYIALGMQTPLLKAFADWVESGYSALRERPRQACSWRFWARGMKRQELVCGLLRDSNDSVGRQYPLLIFGTGPLDGWEETWDLLPYVFEGIWSRMEYVGSKRSFDIPALQDDIGMLPYPTLFQGTGAAGRDRDMHEPDLPGNGAEFFGPVRGAAGEDPSDTLVRWHTRFKRRDREPPNAVFMGGVPENAHLALFRRSLSPQDFIRLWTSS